MWLSTVQAIAFLLHLRVSEQWTVSTMHKICAITIFSINFRRVKTQYASNLTFFILTCFEVSIFFCIVAHPKHFQTLATCKTSQHMLISQRLDSIPQTIQQNKHGVIISHVSNWLVASHGGVWFYSSLTFTTWKSCQLWSCSIAFPNVYSNMNTWLNICHYETDSFVTCDAIKMCFARLIM